MLISSMTATQNLPADRPSHAPGTGGFLVAVDGREMPLVGASIHADASAGVATVILRQTFRNPYAEALNVKYTFPLPVDGAVSGYAFLLQDRRITGEVDRKQRARQRYEEALAQGRTAGIVEQDRPNLFTQELGNVPPHSEIVAELRVDQRLAWLAEGAWEFRFPTSAGPRYMGAPGRVADEARNTLAYAADPLPVGITMNLVVRDVLAGGALPQSSSHAVRAHVMPSGAEVAFVTEGGVPLDRDIVVRWNVAGLGLGTCLDVGRPATGAASSHAYGLLTLVPPQPSRAAALPREVCLLLDISGSMSGEPLAQVKAVCHRILDALTPQDRLEMIAFSSSAVRFQPSAHFMDRARGWVAATVGTGVAHPCTPDLVSQARTWLDRLRASGGTEMVNGIIEALAPLSPSTQRQVVLLTDGYVGFEEEVVRTLATRMPAQSRFHVVGVGSAVNRALTRPASRAGRGVEFILAPGEEATTTCGRLLSRLNAPVATDITLEGSALVECAPARLPDVYAASPMVASLRLRAEGGTLVVKARTAQGTWTDTLHVPAIPAGDGPRHAATMYAREAVEDLELLKAHSPDATLDGRITALGLDFQVATAFTTWVAISSDVTVDPTRATRNAEVPQQLPHGVSAVGVGLRPAASALPLGGAAPLLQAAAPSSAGGVPGGAPARAATGRMRASVVKEAKAEFQDEGGIPAMEKRKMSVPAAKAAPAAPAKPAAAPPPPAEPVLEREEAFADGAAFDEADMSLGEPGPMMEMDDDAGDFESPITGSTAPELSDKQAKGGPARQLLVALVRLMAGRQVTLSVVVPAAGLQWTLPGEVQVRLSDGRVVTARVLEENSTAAGTHAAGTLLRLVIELADEPLAATPEEITGDTWSARVTA